MATCCYCLPLRRTGALAVLTWSVSYSSLHIFFCLLPPSRDLPSLPSPLALLLFILHTLVLLCCLPLLPGILLPRPLLLLPWTLATSVSTLAEIIVDLWLATFSPPSPELCFLFTLVFFILGFQVNKSRSLCDQSPPGLHHILHHSFVQDPGKESLFPNHSISSFLHPGQSCPSGYS